MEVATGRARLVEFADDGASAALATIPRSEIEDALRMDDGPPELILDVTRNAGEADEQTGSIYILWGPDELAEVLRRAEGDSVTLAFDPGALLQAFDAEVEAHGLREAAAVLAVAVAAGTAAGVASAQPDQGTGSVGGATTIEQVRSDAGAAPGATIEAVRSTEGVQTLSASGGAPIAADIEAARSAEAATLAANRGPFDIEGVRLAQGSELLASETAPVAADIEAVRSAASTGGVLASESVEAARSTEIAASVVGTQSASDIEAVRTAAAEATRAAADTGGSGISISLPSPEVTGALAGGIALLITGAAFAARRQRPVRPA